jgi:uncharacterized membrane protein required for colicin V production
MTNWVTYAVLAVLAVFTLLGVFAGIVRTLFILAGGIVGVFLAGRYTTTLVYKLHFTTPNLTRNIAHIVVFVLIIVAVMLIGWLIAYIVRKLTKVTVPVWADRFGGGLLGLFLGIIFSGAMLICLLTFSYLFHSSIIESPLTKFVVIKVDVAIKLLPQLYQNTRN